MALRYALAGREVAAICAAVVVCLAVVSGIAKELPQRSGQPSVNTTGALNVLTATADAAWSGSAQCRITIQGVDYLDEVTHTWTLTGGAPVAESDVIRAHPATWTVSGNGHRDVRTPEQHDRWSTDVARSAPISIWITPQGLLRIARRANLEARGIEGTTTTPTPSGPQSRPFTFAVSEWPFPQIEVPPSAAISDVRQAPVTQRLIAFQPAGAVGSAACTWNFTRADRSRRDAAGPSAVEAGAVSLAVPNVTGASLSPRLAATSSPTGARPAVSALRASPTYTTISLRWNCVSGASGYEVLATPRGGTQAKLTATTISPNCAQDVSSPTAATITAGGSAPSTSYSTGFTHAGLTPGNEFSYVVRALYASGPVDSQPLSAHATRFPAITGVMLSQLDDGGVSIEWPNLRVSEGSVISASGYVLSRKLAGESAFTEIARVGGASGSLSFFRHIDGPVPVGRHEYTVHALDGESGAPAVIAVGAPRIWQATTDFATFDLGFTGVRRGGVVTVLASTLAAGPFTDVTGSGVLSGQHWETIPQLGTALYYKVRATYPNVTFESSPQPVSFMTHPPIVRVTAKAQADSVQLEWDCPSGVTFYNFIRRPGNGRPFEWVFPFSWTSTSFGGQNSPCNYIDKGIPPGVAPATMQYVVVGYDKDEAMIGASRVSAK